MPTPPEQLELPFPSLGQAVLELGSKRVRELLLEAEEKKLDFYTLVCSVGLQIPYEQVHKTTRNEAKVLLFSMVYDVLYWRKIPAPLHSGVGNEDGEHCVYGSRGRRGGRGRE